MTEATPTPTRKPRHDAFDGPRRRKFLDALGKCGCLRDAARKAEVSHQTVYNHQARDPGFARQCELALDMASTDIELHAWERGVIGVEEPIVRGGQIIGTRLKRSDAILRLLLQSTKRKKYGPNPGFGRKRLHRMERKRIEEELRAERYARDQASKKDLDERLMAKLAKMADGDRRRKLSQGWTDAGDVLVPPGWVRAELKPNDACANIPAALAWSQDRAEEKDDSV